jgi:hypothetical protein
MQNTVIADTPEKIQAFRLLALKGALKLETKGLQMSRGVRASVMARDVLAKAGKPAPANKVKLLAAFESHLREIGVLVDKPANAPGVFSLASTTQGDVIQRVD